MNVGILGGGISGVGLQHFLKHPSEILEKESRPGGLCQTIFKDGFGYDIGGHILFTKNQAVNSLVEDSLNGNLNHCRRANKILFKGRLVKYPFENQLSALDKQDTFECLSEFLKRDYPKPQNLKEWCYYTFGKGISERYLIPYNEKIWKMPAEQMGLEWVERIPNPPTDDIVKSALGIETEGYLHQLNFKYPTRGGVEALVSALRGSNSKVICDFGISKIRKEGARWVVSNGSEERVYDHIVITFPIHEAIRCFANVPENIRRAVDQLHYNSINIVMVAVKNESLLEYSAIYIPDPEAIMHRICYMGFFSKELIKPGTSSLIAEITSRPGDGVHEMSNPVLIEKTIEDLHRLKIIEKKDVIATDITRRKYGYPIYDLHYSKNTALVRSYFREIGIDLLGRFAEFDYINSDECLRRAMGLAEILDTRKVHA